MTKREMEVLVKGLAPAIVETIKRTVDPLKARIAALEQRPTLKYVGVHEPGTLYREGCFCTVRGGIWLATRDTAGKPGSDDSGWRLVCKEGHAG